MDSPFKREREGEREREIEKEKLGDRGEGEKEKVKERERGWERMRQIKILDQRKYFFQITTFTLYPIWF